MNWLPPVEIVGQRQAVLDEGAVADFHAAVAIFLGLELAPQRLACGIVG